MLQLSITLERPRHRTALWALLGFALFALAACNADGCGGGAGPPGTDAMQSGDGGADAFAVGDVGYDCPGETLRNVVPAADWVRANTDIFAYRYEADRSADTIALRALREDGTRLGSLTIEGFFGTDQEAPREVSGHYVPEEGPKMDFTSLGLIAGADQMLVRNRLTRQGTTVEIRSYFETMRCYANDQPTSGAAHRCVWPVPVAKKPYAVPSCGFDIAPQLAAAPNLRALTYRTEVSSDPGIGGWRQSDHQTWSTFKAVDGRSVVDTQKVRRWLKGTGAGEIIGTNAEQRFSAAFGDPAWIDHIETHISRCQSEEATETAEQGLGGLGCARRLGRISGDFRTVKQGQGCGLPTGSVSGDPHIETIDGSGYDMQGAGEYVLAEATAGDPFELQARFEQPPNAGECRPQLAACNSVTIPTAAATKLGEMRVAVYATRDPALWIDGKGVERLSKVDLSGLPEDGIIHEEGEGKYTLIWPSGVEVELEVREDFVDIRGTFPSTRAGQLVGLWGAFNGDPTDDFELRSGRAVQKPYDFETLHRVFGNSWRVRRDASLFDYEEGNTTATYTKPGFPTQKATIDDLPDGPVADARQACSDIEHPEVRDWCTLDVVCTCDKSIAASTRDLTGPRQTTDPTPDGPLTVGGDVCLQEPDSLSYRPAPEPTCPQTSSPCIHLVREKTGVKLSTELPVDARDPGRYDEATDLQSNPIAAGTTVDSYLLHLNETNERTGALEGMILLPAEILGVAVTKSSLKAGDSPLVESAGDLPTGRQGRGLEWESGDAVKIGPEERTLRFELNSTKGLDQIRVVTKGGSP